LQERVWEDDSPQFRRLFAEDRGAGAGSSGASGGYILREQFGYTPRRGWCWFWPAPARARMSSNSRASS